MSPAHENVTALRRLPERVEELMDDTTKKVRQLPSRAMVDRVDRRRQRGNLVTVLIVALIAITGVVWGYRNSRDIATTQLNSASIQALNDVRTELKARGVPESQLPPTPTVMPGPEVDVNAIVQATLALVLAEVRSDPQYRGPTGTPGLNGQPCDPVVNVKCVGPPGNNGSDGSNGVDGQSPPCLSTPAQCQGADGRPGANGADGAPGPRPVSARFDGDGISSCDYVTVYSDQSEVRASAPLRECL